MQNRDVSHADKPAVSTQAAPVAAEQQGQAMNGELITALVAAQQAINSMKDYAETAGQGDEESMLYAMGVISDEGLTADIAIRVALSQAAPVAASDWTEPTTYLRRFGDAMQLLCAGHRPTHAMMSAWLDSENEELQSFAAEHGPAWAQGIGLIDAARTTADQPTEGPDHEFHEAAFVAAEPSDAEIVLSALSSGEWGLVRNLPNDCFTDNANLRHLWSVRRLVPPYCADRHDSERQWSGPTARQALQTASDDLDVPLPAALAVSPAPQAAPVAAVAVELKETP